MNQDNNSVYLLYNFYKYQNKTPSRIYTFDMRKTKFNNSLFQYCDCNILRYINQIFGSLDGQETEIVDSII